MADKIVLRGAQFHGRHGVSDEERIVGGRIIVDVELEYDLTRAGESDRLSDTVNYSAVFKMIQAQVELENFHLLEALAHKIADTLLTHFPLDAVTVYVRKQPPPIKGVIESAGVQIRRSR